MKEGARDDYGRLRQSELAFLGPDCQTPPHSTLITDFAMHYRPQFRHQVG